MQQTCSRWMSARKPVAEFFNLNPSCSSGLLNPNLCYKSRSSLKAHQSNMSAYRLLRLDRCSGFTNRRNQPGSQLASSPRNLKCELSEDKKCKKRQSDKQMMIRHFRSPLPLHGFISPPLLRPSCAPPVPN